MTHPSTRRALLAFGLALMLPALAHSASTVGSGQVVTETRPVPDFEAISTAGAMRLVVRQADRAALQLRADDNVLPLIETVVEPRRGVPTLLIRLRDGASLRNASRIVVTVDVVRLSGLAAAGASEVDVGALKTPALKLSLAGASDASLQALTTESLELSIAGSGKVKAAGQAGEVKLSIAGSGDANLADLAADDVKVSIAGSGDASVTANRALKVSIAGSGDVRYAGTVTDVKRSVVGSGNVRRR